MTTNVVSCCAAAQTPYRRLFRRVIITMTDCNLESSPVDWIIDHPSTLALFEEFGIDYSCAGKSLEYNCHQRGLDPQPVLARLLELIRAENQIQPEKTN